MFIDMISTRSTWHSTTVYRIYVIIITLTYQQVTSFPSVRLPHGRFTRITAGSSGDVASDGPTITTPTATIGGVGSVGSGAGLLFPSPPTATIPFDGIMHDDNGIGSGNGIASMMDRIASTRNAMTLAQQRLVDGDNALSIMQHLLQSLNDTRRHNNSNESIIERARAAVAISVATRQSEIQTKLDARDILELLLEAAIFDLNAFIINIVGYALVGSGGITQSSAYAIGSRAAVIRVQLARDAIHTADQELNTLMMASSETSTSI
jgi:hypothetical protein